jgi:uncharacterized membrane protein YcaP (DUF421 family)
MDTIIRVVVIYAFLFAVLRLLGKREFGQLSPLEFICLLLIPEMVQQALVRDDFSMTTALVAVSTLILLVFLTSLVSHRSKKLESVLQGEPTVLVAHGRLLHATMDRERITPDEIFTEMRRVGLDRLEQVRWAVLESDGHISIVAESGAEPGRRGRLVGTESEQPA